MNPSDYANTLMQAEAAGVPVDWKAAFFNLANAVTQKPQPEANDDEAAS